MVQQGTLSKEVSSKEFHIWRIIPLTTEKDALIFCLKNTQHTTGSLSIRKRFQCAPSHTENQLRSARLKIGLMTYDYIHMILQTPHNKNPSNLDQALSDFLRPSRCLRCYHELSLDGADSLRLSLFEWSRAQLKARPSPPPGTIHCNPKKESSSKKFGNHLNMWEFFDVVMEVEKDSSPTHRKYYKDPIPASFVASHRIYQSGLLSSWYLQRTSKVKHWVLLGCTWKNPWKIHCTTCQLDSGIQQRELMTHDSMMNPWSTVCSAMAELRSSICRGGSPLNIDTQSSAWRKIRMCTTWRCFLHSSNAYRCERKSHVIY